MGPAEASDLREHIHDNALKLPLGLYSAEPPLIDVVRLRHPEGSEVAWQALPSWFGRGGRRPAQLIELAREFPRAEPALRRAMDVLL
jgi:hypothetical protein